MLKYIVTVTEDLLIPATLVSLLFAYCEAVWKRKGRTFLNVGIVAGLATSAVMAVVKNTTKLIYTNQWNLWIFIATIAVSTLFIIYTMVIGRKRQSGACAAISCLMAAALTALLIFYEAPDVFAYPLLFNTAGNGVLSVDYLVRFIGWGLGLILSFVYMRYLYRCATALRRAPLLLVALSLGLISNAVRCLGQAIRPWLTRAKWLPGFLPSYSKADYPWAFPFSAFVANNTLLFSVVAAGLAMVIPLALFIHNTRITELYNNPAQHRKLKSICRRNRRQATTVVVCFVLSIMNLTVVRAYDSRVIELSPPEAYAIADDNVCIPLAQLEDGHLHRFEYTAESGVKIRWIIIKKPGSASYGVGLDACEVCGDAGYFERGGQVVCKRCDVVMNINTIGFKGGCNPIPLEYRVADGQVTIPLQAVLDGEKEFK
ncbi:MAG: Fe-S-containing protein [Oscillospiraceae bacterium]|nr:Fe-S-containing protein [Oscillospiraceae bacterium]